MNTKIKPSLPTIELLKLLCAFNMNTNPRNLHCSRKSNV